MTATPPPSRRLRKRDVELLLATYDDDPVLAVERALQQFTGHTTCSFDQLVGVLLDSGLMTPARAHALLERDLVTLDALAAELNESRYLRS